MLRKNLTAFAASIVISVGCSAAASAADLFAPSIKDEPIERSFSWTGITVGAHGGYHWGDTDWEGAPEYIAPPLPAAGSGPPNPTLDGGLLGVQIGYNHQIGSLVLGVEADIAFSDINENLRDGNFITEKTELERLGTVRARLGYAVGSWLPYVTGGYAWADTTFTQTCPFGAVGNHCGRAGGYTRSDEDTADGWTIGGGVKYAINDHFIIGAEYLHMELDGARFDLGPPQNGEPITAKWPLEIEADLFKLAVDYKF